MVNDAAFQALYPFESHWLDRGGLRLHYLDEGQGEPVVMVHGNPTWSFYWRNLILALRGQYRCVAPDHIGMGLSDKPDETAYEHTLANRVADLEALLDHLGLVEGVTLVLHDWGGMIGMACAHRRPERIKRLVLLNTAAFLLPESKPFPWQLRLTRTPLGALLVQRFNAFCRGAARFCVTQPMPRDVRRGYLAPYGAPGQRWAVLRFVQDIPLAPQDPAYPIVKEVQDNLDEFDAVPKLICWGLRDFVFDRHFLAQWLKHFPKAEVHRFPEASHYVLEDAEEQVVALIRDFLSS